MLNHLQSAIEQAPISLESQGLILAGIVFSIFAEHIFFQNLGTTDGVRKAIADYIPTPSFHAIMVAVDTLFMEQHKFQVWLFEAAQEYAGADNLLHDKLLQIALANRLVC